MAFEAPIVSLGKFLYDAIKETKNDVEGSGGLSASESGVSLGVNGKSGFVSKRVFRFKGIEEKTIEIVESKI